MSGTDSSLPSTPDDPNTLGGWGWNLLQWVNDEVKASQTWKITIAEDMQDDEWITQTTGQGGAGFDAQGGSGFVHSMRDLLIQAQQGPVSREALSFLKEQFVPGPVTTGWPGHSVSFFKGRPEDTDLVDRQVSRLVAGC